MSENKLKIVLLGDSTVGKTCLTLQYCTGTLGKNHMSTIGVDVHNKVMKLGNTEYRLQIWDTAGQERFRSISGSYLRNTDGVLLLFDLTAPETFDHVTDWLATIRQNCPKNEAIVLIANKLDLKEERKITYEEGLELAKKEGAQYLEVSAFSGENVEKAFEVLTQEIIKNGGGDSVKGVELKEGNGKEKRCC